MQHQKHLGVILSAVLVVAATSASAEIEVIVQQGEDAPDINGQFSLFGAPSLNNAGQVAFLSELSGTLAGQTDSLGIFRGNENGVSQIVRSGESFLGNPVIGFFPLGFYIDDSGSVVGTLATGPPTTFFLFRGDGGALVNLVSDQVPSPSGDNELLGVLSHVVSNDGTQVYRALYGGTNQERGLYERDPNGIVTTRLLDGFVAPRGGVFDNTGGKLSMNQNKQIASIATVTDNNITLETVLRINSTSIEELVREDDLLADGITKIEELGFRTPLINSNGAIAYSGEYSQPGLLSEGVFISDSDGTTFIAGRLLPGGTAAANDISIFNFSDTRQIAFTAEIGVGINPLQGLYIADETDVSLIALKGTTAPGTNKVIDGFPIASAAGNADGEITFLADLADSVSGDSAGKALYRFTKDEGLSTIVQTGDPLNGSLVSDIFFAGELPNSSNHSDDSISGMNETGSVAFVFILDDGQEGIALWKPGDAVSGDFNGDMKVDGLDFLAWQVDPSVGNLTDWESNYGSQPVPLGDFDDNNQINGLDFLFWQTNPNVGALADWEANYGFSSSQSASLAQVPEPCFALHCYLAGIGLAVRRATKAKRE